MNNIREIDNPVNKEIVCSQLFGEFIGFLKTHDLVEGNEYDTKIQEVFQCSNKIIWVDEFSPKLKIVIHISSLHLSVEYGVVDKNNKQVIHRNKLENLRYNISPDTTLELTEFDQRRFNELFNEFKVWFNKLIPIK
jgi:hypothetical protein